MEDNIKDRISHIMQLEQLNALQFADVIGVTGATVNHILQGRKFPSLIFVTAILEKFPQYNADWLLMHSGSVWLETNNVTDNNTIDSDASSIAMRIDKLINHEQMTATEFAEAIQIQSTSISPILSGRNFPSLEVISKIKTKFQKYNTNWLLLGKGNMTKTGI